MSDEEDIEPHERTLARALEAWSRDWSEARLTDYDIALALEMAIAERYAAVGLEHDSYESYLGSYPTAAFCARVRDDIIRLSPCFCNFDSNTDEWHLRYVDGIIQYSEEYIEQSEYPLDTPPLEGMSDFSNAATEYWRRFVLNCRYWLGKFRYFDASSQSYYTHHTFQSISERDIEPELNYSEIEEADAELVAGETPKWLANKTSQYVEAEVDWFYSQTSANEQPELVDRIVSRYGHFYTGLNTRNTSPLTGTVFILPTSHYEPNYSVTIYVNTSLGYYPPYFEKYYSAIKKAVGVCVTDEYEYEVSYDEDICTYTKTNRIFSADGSRMIEETEERTGHWDNYSGYTYSQTDIPLTLTQFERGRLNPIDIEIQGFTTVEVLPVKTGTQSVMLPYPPDAPPDFAYNSKSYEGYDHYYLNIIIDYNTGYSFTEKE